MSAAGHSEGMPPGDAVKMVLISKDAFRLDDLRRLFCFYLPDLLPEFLQCLVIHSEGIPAFIIVGVGQIVAEGEADSMAEAPVRNRHKLSHRTGIHRHLTGYPDSHVFQTQNIVQDSLAVCGI